MDVAEEREGEPVAALILAVGEEAIAADGQQGGPALLDLRRDPDEVGELRRSDPAPVVAVEEQHDVLLVLVVGGRDLPSGRGGERERGGGLGITKHVPWYSRGAVGCPSGGF